MGEARVRPVDRPRRGKPHPRRVERRAQPLLAQGGDRDREGSRGHAQRAPRQDLRLPLLQPRPGLYGGRHLGSDESIASRLPRRSRDAATPRLCRWRSTLLGAEGGVEIVEGLIRAHERQGGPLININVISREKILEAYADPSKCPDLVVRVTGFSTFLSILPPESRKWIVNRLLQQDAVVRQPQ